MPHLEPYSPDLFVGREELLAELVDWVFKPASRYRLKLISAPPGYGKSWLLAALIERLSARPDFFVISIPVADLISQNQIEAWLSTVIDQVRAVRPAISDRGVDDTLEGKISHLVQGLAAGSPSLRPVLIVDGLDEPSPAQQEFLQKQLLEQFWRYPEVRLIVSCRDDYRLTSPLLRRGASPRIELSPFSETEGLEQLQKRANLEAEAFPLAEEAFLELAPYRLTIPGLNTLLGRHIRQNQVDGRIPLLSADEVRACWLAIIGPAINEKPQHSETLESDLRRMVQLSEESWTLETFARVCGYTQDQAGQHLKSLQELSLVAHTGLQRFQIIEGIRQILQLEIKLRFEIEISSIVRTPSEITERPAVPPAPPKNPPSSLQSPDEIPERNPAEQEIQLFLSYSRADQSKVEQLYQDLVNSGYKPWMDVKDILPGENWDKRIRKAIEKSDFFLACLSIRSVDRRGYIQKEIKQALDQWQEKLEDDIYLIPVKLEECNTPDSLRSLQYVELFRPDGWPRLLRAIEVGIRRRTGSI